MTKTRKVNYINDNYKLNNIILQRKTLCKDPGVYFQFNIKFNEHYHFIVNKALRSLDLLLGKQVF